MGLSTLPYCISTLDIIFRPSAMIQITSTTPQCECNPIAKSTRLKPIPPRYSLMKYLILHNKSHPVELSSFDSIRGNASLTQDFIRLFGTLSRNPLNPTHYVLNELNTSIPLDLSQTVATELRFSVEFRRWLFRGRHVCVGGGNHEWLCVLRGSEVQTPSEI